MPRLVDDLKRLTAIPSIAFDGFDKTSGASRPTTLIVALLRGRRGAADRPAGPARHLADHRRHGARAARNRPTVLLYSHYDVQPAGDESLWRTPPFEPTEIDGMIYGRGVADDKSNLISHIGALRALQDVGDGQPPVTLKIVFEGQEEWGSPFDAYPAEHPELFACDAMIIADMGNIEPGVPTFTTALRGTADVYVSLRTLAEPKHSGEYGGPAPDALIAMMRALATLHDDQGNVAVAGLRDEAWPGADADRRGGVRDHHRHRAGDPAVRQRHRSPTGCGRGRR